MSEQKKKKFPKKGLESEKRRETRKVSLEVACYQSRQGR
jgi:hypothetical protein